MAARYIYTIAKCKNMKQRCTYSAPLYKNAAAMFLYIALKCLNNAAKGKNIKQMLKNICQKCLNNWGKCIDNYVKIWQNHIVYIINPVIDALL